ncbi:MAG: sugar transferase [Candidatus Cloacimonetes bacterium]|nr:sugar transferase [Candidatus Cloacimonadota bacterium]
MAIDKLLREKLMKELSDSSIKGKRRQYLRKIMMWQFMVKFSYGLKRVLDIIVASVLMILLSPVFVLTAIVIYLEDPGPVFFMQKRVGKDGRFFDFYKFRSMVVNAEKLKDKILKQNESGDGVIFKMKRDPRITKSGRIIRRFSIDELPQLYNVLLGDMSLVGPRPPLPREVAEYSLEDRKRLHIKPGITCIWQVSGRSDIPFNEQVELDMQYIRSQGVWGDLKILLKTIPAVITGKGAY